MEGEQRVTFTVREVARLMGINVNAAYELARREDFPAIKIGKRIVIPQNAFYRWLNNEAENHKEIAGI